MANVERIDKKIAAKLTMEGSIPTQLAVRCLDFSNESFLNSISIFFALSQAFASLWFVQKLLHFRCCRFVILRFHC